MRLFRRFLHHADIGGDDDGDHYGNAPAKRAEVDALARRMQEAFDEALREINEWHAARGEAAVTEDEADLLRHLFADLMVTSTADLAGTAFDIDDLMKLPRGETGEPQP